MLFISNANFKKQIMKFKKTFTVIGLATVLFSCSKQKLDTINVVSETTSQNQKISGSYTDPSQQGCSLSQGYWFASPVADWPASGVTVGGHTYSEAEAKAIWKTSNRSGLPDSKKAFTQLTAIYLSSGTITSTATVWSSVATAEAYLSTLGKLSPTYLPTGNSSASNAAGAIGNWINANHCN